MLQRCLVLCSKDKHRAPGWQSLSSVQLPVSACVMISGSEIEPRVGLCAEHGLLQLLSLPLPLSLPLMLSLFKKLDNFFFKDEHNLLQFW